MLLVARLLILWVRTQFMSRLATAYENTALQAVIPPSGTAGTVASCTTTNGSPIVTTTNSFTTSNIVAGMGVTGTGIPGSTTVLYVISATELLLSANATATGTVTLTFAVTPQYLSLHTADPGTTGASECTGGSYARQSISFGAASAGANASTTAQNFTSMPSATVGYFGIWTASSSGTYIVGGALTSSLTVSSGATVGFAIGAVTGSFS